MSYGFAPVQLLLKEVRKAFGLTQDKKINKSIKSGLVTKYELNDILECIQEDLKDHVPLLFEGIISFIDIIIVDYIELAGKIQTVGIPRPYLTRYLNLRYAESLTMITDSMKPILVAPLSPAINSLNISATERTINSLADIPGWNDYLKTLTKEQIDHLALWGRGKHLPSSVKSIKFWGKTSLITDEHWKKIITSLNLSKAIDGLKRNGILIAHDKLPSSTVRDYFLTVHSRYFLKMNNLQKELVEIFSLFESDRSKDYVKEKTKELIAIAAKTASDPNQYLVKRAEAHWHVFNGSLIKASKIYKSLIFDCQYMAGSDLNKILMEALVVGSMQKSPDKVLLKNSYNMQVFFGFEKDYVNNKEVTSNNYDDNVEIWLVRKWKKEFFSIFECKKYFEGVSYNLRPPFLQLHANEKLSRPDYRLPNRKVKLKEYDRRIPQLNYWIGVGELGYVKKLLAKGADVLVSSDQNETPLILALQKADKTNFLNKPEWKELAFLILNELKQMHNSDTAETIRDHVNLKTQKRHLRAIELAIDSTAPTIVDTMIKLGANLNSDELYTGLPPLYYALERLRIVKYIKSGGRISFSPHDCNSEIIYRYGIPSISLDNQLLKESFIQVNRLYNEQFKSYVCPVKLRQICEKLIVNGADVNQKITLSNGLQYTPLALCVEINELELFRLMLEHNGNINFTYIDKTTNNRVNLRDIANYFKATDIMPYLAGINM